ncbi:MAG: response regulator [Marinilabilia sp.]
MKTIKPYIKILSFVLIFLFVFPFFSGAEPVNKRFYNINEVYGTSLRGANSICKDQRGFIWLSTKTGVLRLSEDDPKKYLLPYVTADVLTVDLVYRNGQLFAYTNNGQFFRYDPVYDRFDFIFDLREILESNFLVVHGLAVDEQENFFVATSLGLYAGTGKNEFELISDSTGEVFNIEWYDEDHLFVGKSEGIWKTNIRTKESEALYKSDSPESFQPSSLFYDEKVKRLWIGTNTGRLHLYDIKDGKHHYTGPKQLPKHPVLAIEANTDSTVMLGFDGQGLWEMNRKGSEVLNIYREDVDDPTSLSGNGVYDIYTEENNRVWVATYSGGVSFFEQSSPMVTQIKHRINDPNSLINNTVNDVHEDREGNIWFATNNGISRWDTDSDQWTSFYENEDGQARVFLSVYEDSHGNIWGGTWSTGVFVLDGKTGRQIRHFGQDEEPGSYAGNFIFDTTEDRQGYMWIAGVVENILRYNTETDDLQDYGSQPVYLIEEYSENKMILGCSYGLILLDKNSGAVDILMDGYVIHDILIQDDDIWCGTSGGGLIKYNMNDENLQEYTIENGLPSNFVNSVSYANGYFWLGTENGLCRFYPEKEEVLTYSSIIPLANASFNQDADSRLANGKLLFGTNNGAIMFDPALLQAHESDGAIFIQDIIISGKTIRDTTIFELTQPVDSLEEIALKYNQNTITFDLLPLGNSASESKFSWKIEGIEDSWSIPSSNRLLSIANLPSGDFDLKIRLYNNSLSQVIDERTIGIQITPPFWGTWWFYLVAVLFVVGIIYFFLRYHINLIQQLHSEEKIRFFADTAHEIRTSLTLISGPVDELDKESNLSEKGRYYLNLAREQINSLSKVATQLLDFQKFDKGKEQLNLRMVNLVRLVDQRKLMFDAYARKKNIQLLFRSEVDECTSAVDVGMMEKAIDNLISNAVKYSHEGGKVFIELECNSESWKLKVIDEGIGISRKGQKQLFKEFYRSKNAVNSEIIGSGIGLLMVKNYVEKHGGSITCESQEQVGSTFTITIPRQENSLEHLEIKNIDEESEASSGKTEIPENLNKKKEDGWNILIVEDNEKLKDFLSVSLSDDFNVYTTPNGKEAWEFIRKKLPDLVVSDIMMPEMDGFELCRLIKSTYETSHIPIILLTALSEKAQQLQGLGLGADAYLTKPFDAQLLIGRIKSIIANRRTVREKALKLIDHKVDTSLMGNEHNDKFVKKALEVVKSNMANSKYGKEEFALEMNVSTSLLYKKMKSLTDQSPTDFIKSVRLSYALELLKSGEFTVTEVSEKSGFSTVGYFSTVFKKFYGKSPTEISG